MSQPLADTEVQRIPIEQLKLDSGNPRLWRLRPEDGTELDTEQMVEAVVDGFDPEPIGRSIVEHGFFLSDPLIVFPEGDVYVVAEGNRRLVALMLLLDDGLRSRLEIEKVWNDLAQELSKKIADDPSLRKSFVNVPCQVVTDRDEAAPIIGYRHIVGILKWDAYEKAAYVRDLLGKGAAFEDVSDKTGEKPIRLRRYFRDALAIEQAGEAGLDISRAQDNFGRWERAMNTVGVKEYIGARQPSSLDPTAETAYEEPVEGRMANLLSFLFGEEGGPDRLFSDTRRIDDLATALASETGRTILEDERDLDRAFEAAGGLKEFVLKQLTKALTHLQRATPYFRDYADDQDVVDGLANIEDQIAQLRSGSQPGPLNETAEDFDLEDDDDEDEEDESEE